MNIQKCRRAHGPWAMGRDPGGIFGCIYLLLCIFVYLYMYIYVYLYKICVIFITSSLIFMKYELVFMKYVIFMKYLKRTANQTRDFPNAIP